MTLSIGSMVVLYSSIEYLDHKGGWQPPSTLSQHLQLYYSCAILISLVLAIAGAFRDRNLGTSVIAFLLSGLGFLVAATG